MAAIIVRSPCCFSRSKLNSLKAIHNRGVEGEGGGMAVSVGQN